MRNGGALRLAGPSHLPKMRRARVFRVAVQLRLLLLLTPQLAAASPTCDAAGVDNKVRRLVPPPPCPLPHAAADACSRVGEEIGAGVQGSVHAATLRGINGTVALKTLHPSPAMAKRMRSFRHEADALCMIRNANTALLPRFFARRILDDDDGDAGVSFLALELIPQARTLLDLVVDTAPNPLAFADAARFVRAVAEALSLLRRDYSLAYRHVQPANVLVVRNRTTLVDFTWATLVVADSDDREDVSSNKGNDGVRHPTPSTGCPLPCRLAQGVAPEWLVHNGDDQGMPDPFAADVYTLGLLLYFAAVSPTETMTWWSSLVRDAVGMPEPDSLPRPDAILRGARPPLDAARVAGAQPALGEARARTLAALIADAWAHDARSRPTASEFAARLANV